MSLSLSIVIPSHSRADLLAHCLASVARNKPFGTQVIVVDDGSNGKRVSQTAGNYPDVEVLRHVKAKGFCAAANAGIAAATGDVVELLNDDAEVTSGWAEAALAHFANPQIAAVAPLILQNDPSRQKAGLPPLIDSAGDEYDRGGFATKRFRGLECVHSSGPVWGASACAAFYRRTALLHAGGFPEHFGAYFEDVDLSFRLRKNGFEIWHEPMSVVWHRVSASYGRRPGRATLERQSANEERVFWRNVGWRYLPRHAAVVAAKAVLRWEDGTIVPWATGRLRAVFGQ
ncbi:MAG TPA: glycosyltransferase [Fimbriiglobus sp.]|jgi:GT2 family glycosyltransferase